jgi:CheY-like chemotaxis protein
MSSIARYRPGGSTIIVVDDDDDIRETVREALHTEGYETAGACNGLDALDQIRASPELPSLILLDLMMPTMDGWEFLHNLEQDAEMRDIPVAMMSAHPSVQGALDSDPEKCGFTRLLLPKPLDFTRLLSFVRSTHLAGVLQRQDKP